MKVGIIGAGAVGGTLAQLLADSGHEVSIANRGPQSLTALASRIVAFAGVSQRLVTLFGAKIVMVLGMALSGASEIWAAHVPVRAHFLSDLAGPWIIAGAGRNEHVPGMARAHSK